MRKPRYGRHKARNLGRVVWQGKHIYFPGEYGSKESLAAFESWWGDLERQERLEATTPASSAYLDDLALAYLAHCKTYYGEAQRGTTANVNLAIKEVTKAMPLDPASHLGPKALKQIRQGMIERGLSRRTINDRVGWIKAWFKWAVSEELIAVEIYQALLTVKDLAKGRSEARELGERQPVDISVVEQAIEELSGVVGAMVRLQVYTGARSGSVVRARLEQFSEGPDGLMLWRPRHKTEHLGHELVLPVGPKCQEELAAYLERAKGRGWLFSPQDCGRRSVRYGEHYSPQSYRRAIVRAQERLEREAKKAGKEPPERWTPHQLRHALGHSVRERFGIEAAQAMLGHSNLASTQVYSERRLSLACDVAREIG